VVKCRESSETLSLGEVSDEQVLKDGLRILAKIIAQQHRRKRNDQSPLDREPDDDAPDAGDSRPPRGGINRKDCQEENPSQIKVRDKTILQKSSDCYWPQAL